jgi:hypothetical protein
MATESRMGRERDISEKVPAILINTRKRRQNMSCAEFTTAGNQNKIKMRSNFQQSMINKQYNLLSFVSTQANLRGG